MISKNQTNYHEFEDFLLEVLKEKFPDAELLIVASGDEVSAFLLEIRQGECWLRFKPYELYCEGKRQDRYEDVVAALVRHLERCFRGEFVGRVKIFLCGKNCLIRNYTQP